MKTGSAIALSLSALMAGACGDASGTGGAGGTGESTAETSSTASASVSATATATTAATSSQTTGAGGSSGSWTLRQSLTKNWDAGDPTWQGGAEVSFDVAQGSTLVLAAYGLSDPTLPFDRPVDSMGQPIIAAVATDTQRATQAAGYVLHNATAGVHTWTELPELTSGDGKLFFMEFVPGGGPSTTTLGAGTNTLIADVEPWLTTGSVTMSSGANPGDLLIAFSFEEEGAVGNANTPYTDPPAGWSSLGVQNDTVHNIGGEACWRTAPDASPQTVTWEWQIVGEQNPTVFKGAIFAVH